MVRRVGFGKPPLPEDINSLPDDEATQSTYSRLKNSPAEPIVLPLFARLVSASFLGLWLLGWSAGIIFSALEFLKSDAMDTKIFLGIWVTFALFGWWFAARTFVSLLRGKNPPDVDHS